MLAPQKYRLYLKRMSGLHPGQNGRKGSGKGSSGSQDANFQVCLLALACGIPNNAQSAIE